MDYLAKNLRVKLPKGRQFNFTDPEGNADRLFVFHRDVDKARAAAKGRPAADELTQGRAIATVSACPSTLTLSHRSMTLPSGPIRYVVRAIPM